MAYNEKFYGGGWRGVQQAITIADPAKPNDVQFADDGLAFYYANLPQTDPAKSAWGHVFEADYDRLSDQNLKSALGAMKVNGKVLLANNPFGGDQPQLYQNKLQPWDGSANSNNGPVGASSPAQQKSQKVNLPMFGELPKMKDGKQLVIVSADDCGTCLQLKDQFLASGVKVDQLTEMGRDPRKGSSFPYFTYE